MENPERITNALKETEILKEPEELISTTKSTTLHYYVLTEPVYLEVFKDQGPETRVRQGNISWEKPKLMTPGYLLEMEGFSKEAKEALQMVAGQHPDLAGVLYQMKYKREEARETTVSYKIMEAFRRLENKIEDEGQEFTVIIKGVDELWDVSLMKYVQELILKSVLKSQLPYYTNKGYLRIDESGYPMVTRNLDGLPIVVQNEIENMFEKVKNGEMDPSILKKELDSWNVFPIYEDRFFNLFKKE